MAGLCWPAGEQSITSVPSWELKRCILYVVGYGAPVGFDLALTYPDRISGIISQNGNAYVEGLGDKP